MNLTLSRMTLIDGNDSHDAESDNEFRDLQVVEKDDNNYNDNPPIPHLSIYTHNTKLTQSLIGYQYTPLHYTSTIIFFTCVSKSCHPRVTT